MICFNRLLQRLPSSRIFPVRCTCVMAAKAFKNFLPLFDRVLVQRFEATSTTKGGIMLPDKSKGKVLEATVVAAGPGRITEHGNTVPICVKVGDNVFLPEYGGTKVILEEKEYYLFRESDILAKIQE
ncbi:10 kDa heat shock protein, mitochondrial [Echinococcus granulosus]|uniref:10 kDa heat shock protein, mitochondrial n=1 Tax=Echinococcus granulosus TaxID=6210 RepID=U6JKU1_ECHGR|nr:heat shock protein [Echinococcus granulosus]EUB55405.1 heat shock protein [Echinococcus granulosus]KAH9279802.1 10 kDa heat shock protein, mitochondrial [Echinococcus granulosus]CDS24756.1 heat shock 10 kDa protein 1 [Echinococcus granulosus]